MSPTTYAQLNELSSSLIQAEKYGALSEKQMALISDTFPRHILEHFLKKTTMKCTLSNQLMSSYPMLSEGLLQELPSERGQSSSRHVLTTSYPDQILSELDPSGRILSNLQSKLLARIPTKGFENLARSHQDVTILFMVRVH